MVATSAWEATLPRRLSIIPRRYAVSDRHYSAALGARLIVSVNGIEQSRVIAYDMRANTVTRYETDIAGHVVLDRVRQAVSVETVRGDVTVRLRAPDGP